MLARRKAVRSRRVTPDATATVQGVKMAKPDPDILGPTSCTGVPTLVKLFTSKGGPVKF